MLALLPEIKDFFGLKPPRNFVQREMVKKAWVSGKIRVVIPTYTLKPVRFMSRNLVKLNDMLVFEPNRELEHRVIYFPRTIT